MIDNDDEWYIDYKLYMMIDKSNDDDDKLYIMNVISYK